MRLIESIAIEVSSNHGNNGKKLRYMYDGETHLSWTGAVKNSCKAQVKEMDI